MNDRRGGFTIVEVLIAVVLLGIGLLTLASSAGGITRMMSNAQRKTRSFSAAASTMDSLRNKAKQSCAQLANGSGAVPPISRSWTITSPGLTNTNHTVRVITSYRAGTRALGDTLLADIYC